MLGVPTNINCNASDIEEKYIVSNVIENDEKNALEHPTRDGNFDANLKQIWSEEYIPLEHKIKLILDTDTSFLSKPHGLSFKSRKQNIE